MDREEKIKLLKKLVKEKKTYSLLSYAQKDLWSLNQKDPQNIAYNLSMKVKIDFNIQPEHVESTLQELSDRHSSLRTTFTKKEGKVVQVLHDKQVVEFLVIDAMHWDSTQLETKMNEFSKRIFDLEKGPLFKSVLFTISKNYAILLISVHHIIFDGFSFIIFDTELRTVLFAKISNSKILLEPLQATYFDFVKEQLYIFKANKEKLDSFWRKKLKNASFFINIPTSYPRSKKHKNIGTEYSFTLDNTLYKKLDYYAKNKKITLHTILLSVFKVLLYKYSNQKDFIVNIPMSERNDDKYENTIGYFINTILYRSKISDDVSFNNLLKKTYQDINDFFKYKDYPFSLIPEILTKDQLSSGVSLLQIVFSYKDYRDINKVITTVPNIENIDKQNKIHTKGKQEGALSELVFSIENSHKTLSIKILYDINLYSEFMIKQMGNHYQNLLINILTMDRLSIAEIPMLSPIEEKK